MRRRGQIDQIPSLTDRLDASGHLQISAEEVLAQNPDLVIGASETVNYQTLNPRGVPVIDEPAYCGGIDGPTTWQNAWDQVDLYGQVFAAEDKAHEYISQLQQRVEQVKKQAEGRARQWRWCIRSSAAGCCTRMVRGPCPTRWWRTRG